LNKERKYAKVQANAQGVPKDDAEAMKWYREAHTHGVLPAVIWQWNGVTVSQVESHEISEMRKAANQGDVNAQCRLGACYATGEGVLKDDVEAAKWYRKAADQGYDKAEYFLGICYAEGQGVPKDYVEAYKWLNLAGQTREDARKVRDEVASRMTPQQIAEAQKLSADWKPKKEH